MRLTAKYIREARWNIRHNDYKREEVDKLIDEIISDYAEQEDIPIVLIEELCKVDEPLENNSTTSWEVIDATNKKTSKSK